MAAKIVVLSTRCGLSLILKLQWRFLTALSYGCLRLVRRHARFVGSIATVSTLSRMIALRTTYNLTIHAASFLSLDEIIDALLIHRITIRAKLSSFIILLHNL